MKLFSFLRRSERPRPAAVPSLSGMEQLEDRLSPSTLSFRPVFMPGGGDPGIKAPAMCGGGNPGMYSPGGGDPGMK